MLHSGKLQQQRVDEAVPIVLQKRFGRDWQTVVLSTDSFRALLNDFSDVFFEDYTKGALVSCLCS